ncbi:hypothetical protein ACFX13_044881 [Malus domestica]
MRGKMMRSVEGEMTKQDWVEPHIPVESSKLWVRSAGPSILETLIEAGNNQVRNSWTIILSIIVHSLHCADAFICFMTQPIEHAMRSTAKALKSNIGFDPLKLHGFCVTDLAQFSFKIEEYYYKSKTNILVPVGMVGYTLECIEQSRISKFGRGMATLWLEIYVAKYINDCIRKLMLDNKP